MYWSCGPFISVLAAFLLVGCQSNKEQPATKTPAAASPVAAKPAVAAPASPSVAAPAPAVSTGPVVARTAIRIRAGATAPYTDSSGNVWLPDQGFADGDTVERDSSMQIANTKDPAIYRTEHYGMTAFSYKLPNGKYTVKLHFAETYEGITGPGERVFSFNVAGHEFKDFDVWVKTGGAQRAYVETVNVEITNGKLDITFTSNVENPEINGIEIIPAS
jgi:uncharacterized protein YcfL